MIQPLLMAATGFASVLGPLLGGTLLEGIGASGCFALITASFLLSFLMTSGAFHSMSSCAVLYSLLYHGSFYLDVSLGQ